MSATVLDTGSESDTDENVTFSSWFSSQLLREFDRRAMDLKGLALFRRRINLPGKSRAKTLVLVYQILDDLRHHLTFIAEKQAAMWETSYQSRSSGCAVSAEEITVCFETIVADAGRIVSSVSAPPALWPWLQPRPSNRGRTSTPENRPLR